MTEYRDQVTPEKYEKVKPAHAPVEKVKPKVGHAAKVTAVVWSVRRHERSITDLEECGCSVCKMAIAYLEAHP